MIFTSIDTGKVRLIPDKKALVFRQKNVSIPTGQMFGTYKFFYI